MTINVNTKGLLVAAIVLLLAIVAVYSIQGGKQQHSIGSSIDEVIDSAQDGAKELQEEIEDEIDDHTTTVR